MRSETGEGAGKRADPGGASHWGLSTSSPSSSDDPIPSPPLTARTPNPMAMVRRTQWQPGYRLRPISQTNLTPNVFLLHSFYFLSYSPNKRDRTGPVVSAISSLFFFRTWYCVETRWVVLLVVFLVAVDDTFFSREGGGTVSFVRFASGREKKGGSCHRGWKARKQVGP